MAADLTGQHRQGVIEIVERSGLGVDNYLARRFDLSPFLEEPGWEPGRDSKSCYRIAPTPSKLVLDALARAGARRHQYEVGELAQWLAHLARPAPPGAPGAIACQVVCRGRELWRSGGSIAPRVQRAGGVDPHLFTMRCRFLSLAVAGTLPSERAGLSNIRLGERLDDQAESRDYALMIIEGDRQAGGFTGE